ncbi:CatA-like O-acetyltransferase [Aeromonas media]|uniref:CatA-like O-acetyltransferase n=1 Tax=Aeromonas media TaxID=651 RepID=UPI002B4869C2|nr:CatA-like O-acetyltransferase [Aeromonas media]
MSNYLVVDESTWARARHSHIFKDFINPRYGVTVELDVTKFINKVRKLETSFTFAMIFFTVKCANDIAAFRYRFLDGRVVLYDQINTLFTYLDKDSELFKVVDVAWADTLQAYVLAAQQATLVQTEYFTAPSGGNVYKFSPLPWFSYTQLSHTFSGDNEDAIPLFNWGRYFQRNDRILLPFSVEVHHSFVDGFHIGKFLEILQNTLDED